MEKVRKNRDFKSKENKDKRMKAEGKSRTIDGIKWDIRGI